MCCTLTPDMSGLRMVSTDSFQILEPQWVSVMLLCFSGTQKWVITVLTHPSSWWAPNWTCGRTRKPLRSWGRRNCPPSPTLRCVVFTNHGNNSKDSNYDNDIKSAVLVILESAYLTTNISITHTLRSAGIVWTIDACSLIVWKWESERLLWLFSC